MKMWLNFFFILSDCFYIAGCVLGLVVETSRYKEVYLVIGLLHLASCVVCLVIPIITRVLRKRWLKIRYTTHAAASTQHLVNVLQANTKQLYTIYTILDQRRRRLSNIV